MNTRGIFGMGRNIGRKGGNGRWTARLLEGRCFIG